MTPPRKRPPPPPLFAVDIFFQLAAMRRQSAYLAGFASSLISSVAMHGLQPKTIQVTDCPLDQIPMWHKKGSVLITTQPKGSTKEQDWSELSIEVFPFPVDVAPPPRKTAERGGVETATSSNRASSGGAATTTTDGPGEGRFEPLRSCVGMLYDTKADWAEPPRTPLRLDQHPTGGASTLRIGGGAARSWRVRVHLLPGAPRGNHVWHPDSRDAWYSTRILGTLGGR